MKMRRRPGSGPGGPSGLGPGPMALPPLQPRSPPGPGLDSTPRGRRSQEPAPAREKSRRAGAGGELPRRPGGLRPVYARPVAAQQPQQTGVLFIIRQQVQSALSMALMQSQQAWIMAQHLASPEVQVTQTPLSVISH